MWTTSSIDLTLRLKGKEIIPENGEVEIGDLPVGGCSSYDTLECLSEVKYRGRVEKTYWNYTDPNTFKDSRVDDIRCKDDECKSPDIGWQSNLGIYRKGKAYYGVVRLGRSSENAAEGLFTCRFEEETPVSLNIVGECEDKIIIVVCHFFQDLIYIMEIHMNKIIWASTIFTIELSNIESHWYIFLSIASTSVMKASLASCFLAISP